MRLFLIAMALVLSVGAARAQIVQSVDVFEYGTYNASHGKESGETSRLGIPFAASSEPTLRQTTRTVVAQLGGEFGFRYRINGTPAGKLAGLTVVAKFPPPGVVGKVPGRGIVLDDYPVYAVTGQELMFGYSFDHESDLVPGIWTIEIWQGNRKLATQSFNVILPPTS